MASRRCLRPLIWAAAVASLTGCASSVKAEPTRDVLGVAYTAGKYNFTDKDFLNEGADELLAPPPTAGRPGWRRRSWSAGPAARRGR